MPLRFLRFLVVAALCLLPSFAAAQTARLVKDINTGSYAWYGSEPSGYTEFNGAVYFSASPSPGESGLWRTDGTAAGTQLVKGGLECKQFLVSAGVLYFVADDGTHGDELWRSDGTTAGTSIVRDINVGIDDGLRFGPVEFAGALYFAANDSIANFELWRSDGTEQGTVLVKDIHPTQSSIPLSLTVVDDTLFFAAQDEANNRELWKSDGTSQGTVLVKDINPGPSPSSPLLMVNAAGVLLFRANDGVNGNELWKSDGTPGGTVMVRDINPGLGSSTDGVFESRLFEFNGMAFFAARSGNSFGLWKSDGTFAGTELVQGDLLPSAFQAIGSTLYFFVASGEPNPLASLRLWKTDGTTAGTQLVKDLEAGNLSGTMSAVGDTLYFAAGPTFFEHALWKSNGTPEGTIPLKNFDRSLQQFAGFGDALFFTAYTSETGEEPWTSDGTVDGTVLLKDIGIAPGNGAASIIATASDPDGASGDVYFVGNDGTHGVELWKSDGTAEGTSIVKDINLIDDSAIYPGGELLSVGGTVFFAADDGTNGFELWKSDGTESGTVMIKDINPQPGESSTPQQFTELNGAVLFTAADGAGGGELWRSDGTTEGTAILKDIYPAPPLVRNGNRVFFTAQGGATGRTLWKTDGTTNGTVLVKDIYPAQDGPYVELVRSGDLLYFRADVTGPGGTERLWRSDGTAAGTFAIHTFTPVPNLLFSAQMTDVDGTLFFFQGSELWKSDGTAQGTTLVANLDITPVPPSNPSSVVSYGGFLFFTTPENRMQLWRSNGTAEGTVVVKEFDTDSWLPHLQIVGQAGGALFVSAGTNGGYQLWRSHGTAETTTAIPNVFIDAIGTPASMGSNIFFAAVAKDTGRELWTAPLLPAISSGGVVDAAGFRPTLAPGSLASLFGVELATTTAAAQSLPLPTSLAGASIQVNGVDAPLLFVSPKQINFQVPFETATGASSVVALLGQQQSPGEPAAVSEFAPGLFVNPATGGPIVQRHPDGALITAQNPAKPGDILIIYVTGIGGLDNPPATGAPATDSPLASATVTPTVTVGGVEVEVLFAGLAPGFVGLGQINVELPADLPQGSPLPLVIGFGENESQSLELPF